MICHPLGFAATIEVPGEPAILTTLVSVGGRSFEFEGSASEHERVVVALSYRYNSWSATFGLTGVEFPAGDAYELALVGGKIEPGNWRSRRLSTLWSPPD